MSFATNIQVIYKKIPDGLPVPEKDFQIKKTTIVFKEVDLKPNEILLRTLYISVDPYMRARMRDPAIKSYFPAAEPGKPMTGGVVGEVIRSNAAKFAKGDVVIAFASWEQYTIVSTIGGPEVKVIPNAKKSQIPLSYYLGILGMPGLTAYIGLHKICEPLKHPDGKQQTIFVSAAAGAVGHVVGQYAKSFGLRVVGSAGSDDKVDYMLKELGYDAAFNYKNYDDYTAILKETCPEGIDIYFENVGGKMLDAVLVNANDFARIAVCGMISQYNRMDEQEPVHNLALVISKRIHMEGFVVSDDAPKYLPQAIRALSGLLAKGGSAMKYRETITEGIEHTPKAFVDMLQGKNFGKAVVKVADL